MSKSTVVKFYKRKKNQQTLGVRHSDYILIITDINYWYSFIISNICFVLFWEIFYYHWTFLDICGRMRLSEGLAELSVVL